MMFSRALFVSITLFAQTGEVFGRCRTQPGDPGFPSTADWATLNDTIDGRLLTVIPSAEVCAQLNCTEAQWTSSVFRDMIPGQMNQYNWEQDYDAVPPELCLRNGTTCAQGNVPLYAVNATTTEHVQAGIRFAARHNLRVAVKSSGHDYLGRSTAKNSILIWVHYLQNITFTESFRVDGKDLGSAVTLGSGVSMQTIYPAAEQVGKMVVGGSVATAALGGGYIQGAGHSAFSPILGLAADSALQFEIVLSNGEVVTANERSHSDLFWAVRGGGAGSWGVVTSVVVKTYPTFNATEYVVLLSFPSIDVVTSVMTSHAKHVFEWGDIGHYYTLVAEPAGIFLEFSAHFPNTSGAGAIALMEPFWEEAQALGASLLFNSTTTSLANERVLSSDDSVAMMGVIGSRLIPARAYQDIPGAIGQVHGRLIEMGYVISGNVIAGGKVAENANISSAVTPKWRTAKGHVVVTSIWNESTTPREIDVVREAMTTQAVPMLANATGEMDSGAYSNEADVREPDFQSTFFGDNYARLTVVKAKYDPQDLFIVGAGVGSERWDDDGLCTI
ncbi:FAD-binding domain-containing protein [Vararia minispora EC-137]|uniref:FAD-binding domain-containing protein n=1 Tax=Vararia minispora EC-137 TaxID=1314806 RepID=A0ACB8QGQ2_9AGAM|nr:FAD-binding domain-containing protein [Vararia minispora EC-137]